MSTQLDIFEENKISILELEEEVRKAKEISDKTFERSENVRRGAFARISAFEKAMLEKFLMQQQEIDYLKEAIKGK